MPEVHRTNVRSRAADPAARTSKRVYNALNASSVGLELGLSVAIGLLVGYYMDKWLGTEPWLMLAWLTLGLVAGFRGVFRAVARADRAAAEQDKEDGGGHGGH
ncbi:MAG TPA: AtpZ/AtpI family protein [Kofleriaceae bacterium]